MEKRMLTRIKFSIEAMIQRESGNIPVHLHDLSMNGALVIPENDAGLNTGDCVNLILFASGASSDLSMNIRGFIHRSQKAGIAIVFDKMDLESFIHLKNILAYNTGDGRKIMEEYDRFIEVRYPANNE